MGFGFGGLLCARLIDVMIPVTEERTIPAMVSMGGSDDRAVLNGNEWVHVDLNQPEQAAQPRPESSHRSRWSAQAADLRSTPDRLCVHPTRLYLYRRDGSVCPVYGTAPAGMDRGAPAAGTTENNGVQTAPEVRAQQALKTFAFYGLWILLFINVSCGIALIATAKKMGYEMVQLSASGSTWLVMGLSLCNGLGRIGWAWISDTIGRPNTYIAYFAIQAIAFPLLAQTTGSPALFMALTFAILTCYGGGFAAMPAYISDLFGVKEMPTLLGYILTAWSLAGICGPTLNSLVYARTQSYQTSLYLFGSAFILALLVALWMKRELRHLQQHHRDAAVKAAHTPARRINQPLDHLRPATRRTGIRHPQLCHPSKTTRPHAA